MATPLKNADASQAVLGSDCSLTLEYNLGNPLAKTAELTIEAGSTTRVVATRHEPAENGIPYGLLTVPMSTSSVWAIQITVSAGTILLDRFAVKCGS